MLRRIRLKNFIHFEEEDIRLHEGSNFCIGQNGSGKSAFLEAIRRCMSTSKSMGMSSSHDPTLPSIVMCHFDCDTTTGGVKETKEVISCVVRPPEHDQGENTNTDEKLETTIKCVFDKSNKDIFIDILYLKGGVFSNIQVNVNAPSTDTQERNTQVNVNAPNTDTQERNTQVNVNAPSTDTQERNTQVNVNAPSTDTQEGNMQVNVNAPSTDTHELLRLFSDSSNDVGGVINEIIKISKTHGHIGTEESRYNENTACETFLKVHIDQEVVITYPMRNTSPIQWTYSRKLDPKRVAIGEQEIQERAEILSWYFDPKNDAMQKREQVEKYFDIITDNCAIKFQRREDGHLFAYEREGTTKQLNIEKVPEGYYEAMHCAILLAYPRFKTVCLEEPGRGMHPQMVERLRDLILNQQTNKVVILTSHKPSFITSWNIPRMLFFRKVRSGKDILRLKIIPGVRLVDEAEDGGDGKPKMEYEKTRRLTTTRHFTTLYFARRVLLVEGESDILFFTELKSILLLESSKSLLTGIFQDLKALSMTFDSRTDSLIDEFRRFLWPLHILGLNGETNKGKVEKVCKRFEIERYFVLDYDAITDKLEHPAPETFSKFRAMFDLSYNNRTGESISIDEPAISQDVRVLEEVGIFVWHEIQGNNNTNKGTIESAIKELHTKDPNSGFKEKLETNKVFLKWNDDKPERRRHKLFVDKLLKDENIRLVVEAVVEQCQRHKPTEFFRFLEFLCKMFLKQKPEY